MNLDIGFVDSWEVRNKEATSPSHRKAVIFVEDLIECVKDESEKGNLVGERGFSAGLFLKDLLGVLRKAKEEQK